MQTPRSRLRQPWMLVLPVLLLTGAWCADEGGPRDVVRKATSEVAAVLADESRPREEQRQAVEAVLDHNLDVDTVAKLAMARNWKHFTSEQKAEFVVRFRTYLVLNYWNNVRKANLDRIEIVADSEKSFGDWEVQTKVVRKTGGKPIRLNYRLRRLKLAEAEQGPWRIIDISVEGAGMVSNFRKQFTEIFPSQGATGVLDKLGEKNQVMLKREQKSEAIEEQERAAGRAAKAAKED